MAVAVVVRPFASTDQPSVAPRPFVTPEVDESTLPFELVAATPAIYTGGTRTDRANRA